MTKKQRALVVELLRCGADLHRVGLADDTGPHHVFGGIGVATNFLDASYEAWEAAKDSWEAVAASMTDFTGWTYGDVCLEAAARVEEGSWP